MDVQERRIGRWCAWGVALLSWIGFFLVLALIFRAAGCNRGSEAGSKSMDVVAGSLGFEARSKTAAAAGATRQSQLLAGDRSVVRTCPIASVAQKVARQESNDNL